MTQTLRQKLHSSKYFSTRLILVFDLLICIAATILAVGITSWLVPGHTHEHNANIICIGCSAVFSYALIVSFRTYQTVIRHSTLRDVGRLMLVALLKTALLCLALFIIPSVTVYTQHYLLLFILDFMLTCGGFIFMRVCMVFFYDRMLASFRHNHSSDRVMVYGTDNKSVSLVTRLKESPHYEIVGFIVTEPQQQHLINGLKIYCVTKPESMKAIKDDFNLNAIIFPSEDDARDEQERLMPLASKYGIKSLLAPGIDEYAEKSINPQAVREVKIEDLLGRPEIKISMKEITDNFHGKVVMVTGAAGSIGSELCRQLAGFGVERLILFDNGETPMHNLRLELEEKYPWLNFVPVIGDVRLLNRLDFAFRSFHPQIVFHAAAYKHVPLMEENPCEAVLVNSVGSSFVAKKCLEYGVEQMVMISTDKAVNPTNIMGCTKRLAEIFVQSLGLAVEKGEVQGKTKFVTTRFGNVLGSNGSVIPRFRDQIAKGGPVTVTHPDITRFFMTIPEACRLVMEAATMTDGNQIFVFDMGQSVKIAELAKRMITLAGYVPDKDIKIEYTGLRPGEKLYEEVLSNCENTLPTSHDRIRIAQVREYDFAEAQAVINELERLSRAVNIPDTVRLMKRTVPEYVSKNSVFEKYDKETVEVTNEN